MFICGSIDRLYFNFMSENVIDIQGEFPCVNNNIKENVSLCDLTYIVCGLLIQDYKSSGCETGHSVFDDAASTLKVGRQIEILKEHDPQKFASLKERVSTRAKLDSGQLFEHLKLCNNISSFFQNLKE